MIAYLVPGFGISGGVRIILEHVNRLKDAGLDVVLISYHEGTKGQISWFDNKVPIYIAKKGPDDRIRVLPVDGGPALDISQISAITTCLWFGIETLDKMDLNQSCKKYYFIQGRDSMSYEEGHPFVLQAEATYKRTDLIPIVVSNWLKDILEKEYNRTDVILAQNAVDYDFWNVPVRDRVGKKVLLIEGSSCETHKGIEEALKVCKAVKEVLDVEVWWLSKSDKDKPEVVDQLFYNVDREKCRYIYQNADVLLKTTHHDGWGLPHLEALASGCGLVTTNAGGNLDFCYDGVNSFVVPVKDINSMAQNVVYLLEDDALRQSFIENGKKRASELTWNKTINLLKKVYEDEGSHN